MDALIKAVRSLLNDIEAMQNKEYPNEFSDFDTGGQDIAARYWVEWPNLAVSAEAVKKALNDAQNS